MHFWISIPIDNIAFKTVSFLISEVLAVILNLLGFRDQLMARMVCKLWFETCAGILSKKETILSCSALYDFDVFVRTFEGK